MSRVFDLVLGVFREPGLVADLRDKELPENLSLVIRLAAGEGAALQCALDTTGETAETLVDASVFFLQQVLFAPAADSYRVLGADSDAPQERLRDNYRWLMKWLHPDRNQDGWEAVYADRVNVAWQDLKTPDRRAEYDRRSPSSQMLAPMTAAPMRRVVPVSPVPSGPLLSGSTVRRLPTLVLGTLGVAAAAMIGITYWAQSATQRELSELRRDRDAPTPALAVRPDPVAPQVPEAASDTIETSAAVAAVRADLDAIDVAYGDPAMPPSLASVPDSQPTASADLPAVAAIPTAPQPSLPAGETSASADLPAVAAIPTAPEPSLPAGETIASDDLPAVAAVPALPKPDPVPEPAPAPVAVAAPVPMVSVAQTADVPIPEPPVAAATSTATVAARAPDRNSAAPVASTATVQVAAKADPQSAANTAPPASVAPPPATRPVPVAPAKPAVQIAAARPSRPDVTPKAGTATVIAAAPTGPANPPPPPAAPRAPVPAPVPAAPVKAAEAAAPAPAVATVAPPPRPAPAQHDAEALVREFASAYAAGDLARFDRLFTRTSPDVAELIPMRSRFGSTEMRYLEIQQIGWHAEPEQGRVRARYRDTYVPRGGRKAVTESGVIEWTIRVDAGDARIASVARNNVGT